MQSQTNTTRWPALLLASLIFLTGCAASPPRQPTAAPVDREQLKAALRQDTAPALPGPPPFSPQIMPRTMGLDLPETLYAMTLDDVPLSAAIQA
ncbi:MAG: hypothetical protein WBY88_14565, partial [Desulfosarcina sp.]